MRVNSALLTTAVLCSAAFLTPTAQANELVRKRELTGEGGDLPSPEFLLVIDTLSPLRPVLAKRSLPKHAIPANIPIPIATPVRSYSTAQALPALSPSVSGVTTPRFADNASTANSSRSPLTESRSLEELLATAEQIIEEVESGPSPEQDSLQQEENFFADSNTPCQSNCAVNETTGTVVDENILTRSVPSLEDIQQIQQDLRNLNVPASVRRRRAYPGITISNPTGYGADRGQIFAGVGFQSRTRFSGGDNPGTIFGGGKRDGTVGVGFGIGDARESVGFQIYILQLVLEVVGHP